MWYIIDGFILYFLAAGLMLCFIWCTRTLGRRYRRKKYERELRTRARDMVNGSNYHIYNKQALGRLVRSVTRKGKYN